jgi:hypothetical protein
MTSPMPDNAFLINDSYSKIELIDIRESSELTDNILRVLLDVYNDSGCFACHGETTHIIVLYDNEEIIGGALLRVSLRIVVIKRLCVVDFTSFHSSVILQFVKERYIGNEIHSSPKDNAFNFFMSNGFVVSRRRGCLCKSRKELTHLVWNPLRTIVRVTSKIQALIDS